MEDVALAVVGEGDTVEHDLAAEVAGFDGIRPARDGRRQVHDLREAPEPRDALLQLGDHVVQMLDGVGHTIRRGAET